MDYTKISDRLVLLRLIVHASVETTKICAYADSEMKRAAMEKADAKRNIANTATPIWQDNDDMILQLFGLKK